MVAKCSIEACPEDTTETPMTDTRSLTADETLQLEFNRWAEAGEGEKMEQHHLDITLKTLRLMDLRAGQTILDLGCGSGWATRLLAKIVGPLANETPNVVGLDISDEMIRLARETFAEFNNIRYVVGSVTNIAEPNDSFDRILSVESFYYYPNQGLALDEVFRVMAPGGRIYILINLYADNEYSLQWVDKLKVPVHVRSAAEYVAMLRQHGFEKASSQQIPDDTPTPDGYKTKSFKSLEDLRAFKRIGALLLTGSKPAS